MFLIRGGLVKTMEGMDIEGGSVLVNGKKILAVGKDIFVPAEAKVIEAEGCIITPGLIDAHTHIGVHEEAMRWEGADYNERTNPITPQMRAIDAINPLDETFTRALHAGVTCAVTGPGSANVLGGTFLALKLSGRCVDEMVVKNPVAMKAAFGENPKHCYGQEERKSPITRMGIAALLREELSRAKDYERKLQEAKETPDRDLGLEALLPVLHKEIPLKCHAHRADDILTALRIAHEFDLNVTLDHCTEGHLISDILAKEGFPVLVGPSLGSKTKIELKSKSFETVNLLYQAGLSVSIITDSPVIPLEYLPLCAGLAIKAGLPEQAAWEAITINPAKAAGIADRVGSLAPGKDADIVVFEGNPLREIQARPRQVFLDGEPQL